MERPFFYFLIAGSSNEESYKFSLYKVRQLPQNLKSNKKIPLIPKDHVCNESSIFNIFLVRMSNVSGKMAINEENSMNRQNREIDIKDACLHRETR